MFHFNIDNVVIGLGNIGDNYNMTRHNMGFMVLDMLAKNNNFKFTKNKFCSLVAKDCLFGKKVIFMKPSVYMNNSGLAAVDVISFYKVPMEKIIIVYDDITLDLGKIKIKKQGSHGGHNGVKNIIELTGSSDFGRIKVGISGKPKDYNLVDWVLSKFKDDEMQDLQKGMRLACNALETIIKYDIDVAMNQFNKREKK